MELVTTLTSRRLDHSYSEIKDGASNYTNKSTTRSRLNRLLVLFYSVLNQTSVTTNTNIPILAVLRTVVGVILIFDDANFDMEFLKSDFLFYC